ncbi:MAG: peptide ABC transporter permease [Candidatus Tectimicrobiota bacterium]|nr:MAG: peptide ABC transporter permease [Candidatus Tectomicrobia bacterium]
MVREAPSRFEAATPPLPPPGRLARVLRRAWRFRTGLLGAAIVLLALVAAVWPQLLAPHDPYHQQLARRLLPPVWEGGGQATYLLGTDHVGRDYLSRIVYGSRVSLLCGFLATALACAVGVTLGVVAGYYGGVLDSVISNLVNIMLAFPFILLALAVIAVMGPSFTNLIIVLGLTTWTVYTRVVRAEVLTYRERDFVVAATSLGSTDVRVILRHILPNLINTIVVLASLEVARNILREAFLSFLGLGIQPPTPSWGGMLSEGRVYMLNKWWLATFPGLAIFLTTLGINLLGDSLRDLLDPHLD